MATFESSRAAAGLEPSLAKRLCSVLQGRRTNGQAAYRLPIAGGEEAGL